MIFFLLVKYSFLVVGLLLFLKMVYDLMLILFWYLILDIFIFVVNNYLNVIIMFIFMK